LRLNNLRTITVLVIDETYLLANKIADMIDELLCVKEVFVCTNYAEINTTVQKEKPEVVLFEIHHTKENGLALLKAFRLLYPNIKIIVVTNNVSSFYKEECKALGTHFFLDKSNDFESIPSIIRSLCN
jgi:DNA-binding NarL/FixJ family response regulator